MWKQASIAALSAEALRQIAQTTPLDQFQPTLILSHLANADSADNPSNANNYSVLLHLKKFIPAAHVRLQPPMVFIWARPIILTWYAQVSRFMGDQNIWQSQRYSKCGYP